MNKRRILDRTEVTQRQEKYKIGEHWQGLFRYSTEGNRKRPQNVVQVDRASSYYRLYHRIRFFSNNDTHRLS